MTATADPGADPPARVPRSRYFFPAHNEEANLEGLVAEALETLPTLADEFEIIAVNDGSKDRTREIADRARGRAPGRRPGRPPRGQPRLRRRAPLGLRGVPLRAARVHRRRPPVPGRGPRPADRRGSAEPDAPDVVVGYRIKRADPFIRIVYARTYKLANRIFFGLRVRDVDCACKLFRREALEGVRVESGGAFFSAELLIKVGEQRALDRRGRRAALPADGRLADRREAVGDLARRQGLLDACACACGRTRDRARRRGRPILGGLTAGTGVARQPLARTCRRPLAGRRGRG